MIHEVSLSFRQDTTSLFSENLLQELGRKQATQISIPPIWTLRRTASSSPCVLRIVSPLQMSIY